MIIGRIGYILSKPYRRNKGVCGCFVRKLHLCEVKAFIRRIKDIELDLQIRSGKRQQIACFLDENAVCLFPQMQVGFLCERKIILFTHHQPF